MNQAQLRAPWEFSKAVASVSPEAGNGPVNGAGIDRTGYTSLIADHSFTFSGAPTGGTVTAQLQDSADNVNFANYGTPVAAQVAASGVLSLGADISGARQFVRVVLTGAPTGGSSPAMTAAGTVRLFGPSRVVAA